MVGLGIEIVGLGFGKYAQKVRICLLNLKSPRLDLALDVCARVSEAVLSTFY
jgi:ribosome maturation factor RimP